MPHAIDQYSSAFEIGGFLLEMLQLMISLWVVHMIPLGGRDKWD